MTKSIPRPISRAAVPLVAADSTPKPSAVAPKVTASPERSGTMA